MEIPFITTITLTWLIYTYLFTEADRQILDLFNRLKFSLSINNKGEIEQDQLIIKMKLGIPEIIELGNFFKKNNEQDKQAKSIEKFRDIIQQIIQTKNFLFINLFIFTIHPLFSFLDCFLSMEIHLILSLIMGLIFYWYIQKLPNERIVGIISTQEK